MLVFGRGKTGVPGETPLGAERRTQLTCYAQSGNQTRATLVEGECSHLRANHAALQRTIQNKADSLLRLS